VHNQIVRNFRLGDFIRVEAFFGRVSEQGVFHTEIQTEESDLTTLPNLYLITHPVTVVRGTGTVISATVSLGYDIPHTRIERVLGEAAEAAGLRNPYVQITDLGDFSVTYRVAGLLEESKSLLAKRSLLRAQMLDKLHANGIEIVSPTFMNQRQVAPERHFIPRLAPFAEPTAGVVATGPQDHVVFRKAEYAALLEDLHTRLTDSSAETKKLQEELAAAAGETDQKRLTQMIERNQLYQRFLESRIQAADEAVQEDDP